MEIHIGEMPRSPTGKIEKVTLRRKYRGAAEAFKI
jgi:hypothetical protein